MDKDEVIESIISVVFIAVLLGFIINAIFGYKIKLFLASDPKSKCEATLKVDDDYCLEDGSRGNRTTDKKNACQNKAPYFQWNEAEVANQCVRVKYASKSECVADGKQGSKHDDEGSMWYTQCLDDGTWKSFDPDYQDYTTNPSSVTCKDVTSYDYNWDNDMLCTSPDGKQFHTSYEGAQNYR